MSAPAMLPELRVYFLRGADKVKIGRSRDVRERVADLRRMSPVALELLGVLPDRTTDGRLERDLHRRFRTLRTHGEWFRAETLLLEFIEQAVADDAVNQEEQELDAQAEGRELGERFREAEVILEERAGRIAGYLRVAS